MNNLLPQLQAFLETLDWRSIAAGVVVSLIVSYPMLTWAWRKTRAVWAWLGKCMEPEVAVREEHVRTTSRHKEVDRPDNTTMGTLKWGPATPPVFENCEKLTNCVSQSNNDEGINDWADKVRASMDPDYARRSGIIANQVPTEQELYDMRRAMEASNARARAREAQQRRLSQRFRDLGAGFR